MANQSPVPIRAEYACQQKRSTDRWWYQWRTMIGRLRTRRKKVSRSSATFEYSAK